MFRSLFHTKTIDEILETSSSHGLKRALGPVDITLLGVGAIIGTGIYATIGTAVAGDAHRPGAGPSLMLSFLITAVVCGFTALCYAEFSSMVPSPARPTPTPTPRSASWPPGSSAGI